ncbi:hypothetical protein RHS01_11138 [Rhizoctonia solani]|uniref:Uncharacterized protein n=1 Tax=Rhizoctonia solani TaxID=456999 RepID=A0A8H7I5L4_9AGAM|nr:hypothetical protein RHS01_11138 [Rhizoctonia solani]
MEPALPPTTSVKYGKVSLERVTRSPQPPWPSRTPQARITEIKEAGIKTADKRQEHLQAVNVVKDGLRSYNPWSPHT